MNHIINNIWIGNSSDAKNLDQLKEANIDIVLNVAFDLNTPLIDRIVQCKVGLIDGPGNPFKAFICAVNLLDALCKVGSVLIHCHEGKSRSASVLAAYITSKTGCSLDKAYQTIAEKRPIIEPKAAMYELASNYIQYHKEIST